MADQKLAVEIIFDAIDKTSQVVGDINKGFGELDANAQKLAQPFADLASGLLKTETALLAVGVALVAVSVDKAGKFGDQIAEIGTLFSGTSEQVGKFGDAVTDYAATSTQSIDSINGAIYEAISSGVRYGDSIAFVSEAEKLAVAGRADLTEVTDVLTGTLNAYGAATDQAGDYTDDFLTAVLLGKTTVPELAQSISQVTPIAAAAGIPFGDLSAAIAAVTANGVPTSEAMTKIRAAIETFVSPAKDAAGHAAMLGVSLDTTTLRSLGFEGALHKIYDAAGGSVEKLSKIFTTTEGLQAALMLGADKSGIFAQALKEMGENTGATEAAFKAMSENYEVALQKMANAADVAMIKLGKPLLDEFGGVADAIAGIFAGLGKGLDAGAFDPIINLLQNFGQQAAEVLGDIGRNLPEALEKLDFTEMVRSLEDLGEEMGDLFGRVFGDIDLSTPEGLADAIQKVINIVTNLVDVTRGIAQEFAPFFDVLGGLAENAGKLGEDAAVSFGKFLGAAQMVVDFGAGLGALNAILTETGASFSGVADVVIGTAKAIVNAFQVAFDTVVGMLVSMAKDFVDIMEGITPDFIGDPWKEMSENLGYLLDGIGENWNKNNAEFVAGLDQIGKGLGLVGDSATATAADAEKMKQPIVDAAEASKGFEPLDLGNVDFVAEGYKRLGLNIEDAKKATEELSKTEPAPDWASAEDKARGYKVIIDALGNESYQQVGAAVDATNEKFEDQSKKLDEAQKAAQEWQLKMEELASNERIKLIEASVQLNVAELEAQTEQVKAAFESIDNTVNSTADMIGTLFDALKGAEGFAEKWMIEDMIKREEERRQKALDLQEKLVEAQIQYLQKRAEALGRGDALIRVEADGLQPALEQIWYEIMREIQVKASEEGLELLLGAMA